MEKTIQGGYSRASSYKLGLRSLRNDKDAIKKSLENNEEVKLSGS